MPEPQLPEWINTLGTFLGGGASAALVQWFREARKSAAEARKIDADATSTLDHMLNDRLKQLIDGYEKRIADLTNEVHALRAEVVDLRQALDKRPPPAPAPIGI